jgi:alkylation response protein AidB-like acyl-CoA dehydrogenase
VDLRPTSDQLEIVGMFADVYADHCSPDDVQAAEDTGHHPAMWRRLLDIGALEMALPDESGEPAVSLLDLALVAEQHGRYVAPTPMIEAQVAARLLARAGALGETVDPGGLATGTRTITLAVRPARDSRAELVPAGAVADDAIVLDGDRLLLLPLAGRATTVANLANLPLADVVLGDGVELASGAEAVSHFEHAVDEWRVLTAAALSGLTTRALEIGVEYVKERKAFGRPVGQFQAVQHRLADRASEADGAQLLARKAAWSAEVEPDRFSALAAMALAFGAETAISTSHDALHFHGGYGFMLEYAIQLYYRRARSWGAVLESPVEGYRRVGGEHLAALRAAEGAA